jgi:MMP 1-O-methyltransferase
VVRPAAVIARLDARALATARAARGFMPDEEGLALAGAALTAPRPGPWLEVGSYCGRSTAYLGAAAVGCGTTLVTVDHHRGSEENQPGEQYHDTDLVDDAGRVDTLPGLRRTLRDAGLERTVVAIVGPSPTVAAIWATPLSFLFLDGGHSPAVQHGDFDSWSPHLRRGGLLAIHDVFPDPRDGGRPPYEIYLRALDSGDFGEVSATGSLRVLRRR